jgi:peptidoglycan hydrolase CwlO-like protein
MKRRVILFIILVSIVFSVVIISSMELNLVNAQPNTSTDPQQLLRDFKTAKDTIQNKIQVNFEQLLNVIETQLDFNSVDSYLSQASQYFINGNVSEGILELKKANMELKNSSMTIMNAGDEFVSISKDNSTLMANGTKEILEHFGTVLKDLGTKVDNSMIHLNY